MDAGLIEPGRVFLYACSGGIHGAHARNRWLMRAGTFIEQTMRILKGWFLPKLRFHPFTTRPDVSGGSGDLF